MRWTRHTPSVERQHRILCVEDDPVMQGVIQGVLESEGFTVTVCDSGLDALDELRRTMPELILLDVMMPGLIGTHTMHVIRTAPEYRNIPVIFVTSMTGAADLENYERLGAADVVGKPFRPAALLAAVRRCLDIDRAAGASA